MNRAALAFGLLFSLAGLPAQAATYLVTIGNNAGQAGEPLLRFAERDAQAIASVLAQLGRVQPEHQLLVLGKTAENVRDVLLRTNARIRGDTEGGGSEDALVVYYSGHADATGLHLGDTTMRFEELKTIVESSPARVRILILDSCRSGGITEVKGATPADPFSIRLDDRLDAEGMAIIASSASSEDSQESENLRASFFTHHWVNGLRGAADGDRDGRVTLGEAYAYTYRETLRSSGRTMKLQHPTYAYDIRGKGDVPLTYLTDGLGSVARLGIDTPGLYLVFERHEGGTLAAEVSVSEKGTEILLPPGAYFVQRRASGSYQQYDVELPADQTVRLEDVEYEQLTYSRLLRKGGGDRDTVHNLFVLGAAHGAVLQGQAIVPGILLGYAIDFPWLSFGLGARWGRTVTPSSNGLLETTQDQVALRLKAERFVDLSWFSLSLGLFAEGLFTSQRFETQGEAPDRSGWGLGFGGTVAIERELFSPLLLRLESGPMTQILREARTSGGAAVGDALATPLTWWAAVGLGARL